MAENKVVIDTEINVYDAKKEIKSLESDLKKLETEKKKVDEIFSQYTEMGIAPHQSELKSYDDLISKIKETKNRITDLNAEISAAKSTKTGAEDKAQEIEKIKTASDRASKSIRKMGNSAKSSASGFKIGLKNILKYAFGIRSLFALINKVRSAMVEGFKNLAQFNDGVNPVNTALSNLKSALTQLKNSFAVAFAPILTVVEPILTRLIGLLSSAMNTIGQFFAALTGANTYTKAIKVQENYAKSLKGTAAAAKKAKGQLASIDELNNQSKNDSSSSGSGAVSPNQMFDVAPIENKIAGLASKVKSIIEPLRNSVQNWFSNLNFQPLIDSFNRLKTSIEPITDRIGDSLLWFLENVLEPLGTFTIEDALPSFFNLLASAIELCNTAFDILAPYLKEIWDDVFAPFAAFLGETFVKILNDVADFFTYLAEVFKSKSDQIGVIFTFLKQMLEQSALKWKAVIQFITGMLKPFLTAVANIIGDIIDVIAGLIKFITGVFSGDWKKAWEGIKDIFKGVFNAIVDIFEGVVNMIIGGINNIDIDVPEWVPGLGGKHFGFNLATLSLPRLASGTVVPRQSREFAAILGDNNQETEVVSPLSTMKQAMVEALRESGIGQSNDGDVVVMIDGKEVFRAVKKQNDRYKNRTGKSAFSY